MDIKEITHFVSSGTVVVGGGLDLIHKMGKWGMLPPHLLGEGSNLDTHIGNFGNSAFFTYALMKLLESHTEMSSNNRAFISLFVVLGVNLLVESIEKLLFPEAAPQLFGDVVVGIIGGGAMLIAMQTAPQSG